MPIVRSALRVTRRDDQSGCLGTSIPQRDSEALAETEVFPRHRAPPCCWKIFTQVLLRCLCCPPDRNGHTRNQEPGSGESWNAALRHRAPVRTHTWVTWSRLAKGMLFCSPSVTTWLLTIAVPGYQVIAVPTTS
jgi:hypothetical protein